MNKQIKQFLSKESTDRFLRYVQIYTTSDPDAPVSGGPSSECQWDLLRLLEKELNELNISDIHLSKDGYLYGTLPASEGVNCPAITLLAHVDTSPDQSGENVKPRIIENYDGSAISFPDDSNLQLSPQEDSELSNFTGDDIIVASGLTLLGADDKGGVAEIMAALATFQKFPELQHGEVRVCFTRDEEIGQGVDAIDTGRLSKYCYTIDAGLPGELEYECFDARGFKIEIQGKGVHPGSAKNKMINALKISSYLLGVFPQNESPETTEKREGFYHPTRVFGSAEEATIEGIIRDFEASENNRRIETVKSFCRQAEEHFPGSKITATFAEQYPNMRTDIEPFPEILERAREAILDAGLEPREHPIRGGTDGSKLSGKGHPCPNLSAGGRLFHSKLEWTSRGSLTKCTETLIHLARRWAEI